MTRISDIGISPFFLSFLLYIFSSVLPDIPIDSYIYSRILVIIIQVKSWSSILHIVVICCEHNYIYKLDMRHQDPPFRATLIPFRL